MWDAKERRPFRIVRFKQRTSLREGGKHTANKESTDKRKDYRDDVECVHAIRRGGV
jgi:hypothetical protein